MSRADASDAFHDLLIVLGYIRSLLFTHRNYLNSISHELGLGWYIHSGYGSDYQMLQEYTGDLIRSGNRAIANVFNSLEELYGLCGDGDGDGYNWEKWQEDHFATFGFYYEAAFYDWEKWQEDHFTTFGFYYEPYAYDWDKWGDDALSPESAEEE